MVVIFTACTFWGVTYNKIHPNLFVMISNTRGKMRRLTFGIALMALLGLVFFFSVPVQATSSVVGQRFVVFEGFYNPG
jgi:hypothetical protein